MRKIEARMIAAVLTGGNMRSGNTEVDTWTSRDGARVTTVYLHGNRIAQNAGSGWRFRLGGWNTPTTRSRLNALRSALEIPGRVHCVNGASMLDGKPVSAVDWF